MTCRPQLRGTGIFRPRVKLQNNKQKVRLSNSGSGGANPGKTCQGKRVRETGDVALVQISTMSPPARGSLTQGYQWPLQVWRPWKWRQRACTQENHQEGTMTIAQV